MKKILCLILALCMVMLCACSGDPNPTETPDPSGSNTQPKETDPKETDPKETDPKETDPQETDPPAPEGPTDLDFNSAVTDMGGEWVLSQVYVEGETYEAVENALTFKITLEEDPSELVDGTAYIHNRVYNLTGYLTFGLQEIVDELAADDVESYKGTTAWSDFPQGKVVSEGQWYEQPGPGLMRFKDIDDYGLYLDLIAGVEEDVDTMNKSMILGMNGDGQLLLGFSESHIERPGTSGEWVYLLIFDKA